MAFVLDSRLESSSFFVDDWGLCRVCLKNDKTYPWLYLVPRREAVREIYDLGLQDQMQLISEMAAAAQLLNAVYSPAKVNTAALGNMVPQLHVHVLARYNNDPAWPRPVWAVQATEIPYTEAEKNAEIAKLKSAFQRCGERIRLYVNNDVLPRALRADGQLRRVHHGSVGCPA